MDSKGPGLVRGRGYDSPLTPPAHNYRLPTKFGMTYQLNRGEERIHIDVENRCGGHRLSTTMFWWLIP